MIKQISIYTENRRGAAREILSTFAKMGINVLSLVNSDSGEYGTMRLIVTDTDAAMEALNDEGYLCKINKVLATELEDKPGALEAFLELIEFMNVNINYMYIGYMRETSMPVIIMSCDDIDIVAGNIAAKGYKTY